MEVWYGSVVQRMRLHVAAPSAHSRRLEGMHRPEYQQCHVKRRHSTCHFGHPGGLCWLIRRFFSEGPSLTRLLGHSAQERFRISGVWDTHAFCAG